MIYEGASIGARGRFIFVSLTFETETWRNMFNTADRSDRLKFNPMTTLKNH